MNKLLDFTFLESPKSPIFKESLILKMFSGGWLELGVIEFT
jgi:hypothetical protein